MERFEELKELFQSNFGSWLSDVDAYWLVDYSSLDICMKDGRIYRFTAKNNEFALKLTNVKEEESV